MENETVMGVKGGRKPGKWDWTTWISDAFLAEWKSFYKDKGVMLILLVAVWIYPVIYSIAYWNNVLREIPVVVVDCDRSAASRQLIRMLTSTQELRVTAVTGDFNAAKKQFMDGETNAVFSIDEGFERRLLRGEQSHVGIYCDGSYFLTYKESLRGALKGALTFSAGIEIKRMMATGTPSKVAMMEREPLQLKTHMLFNPAGAYSFFIMPGVILVILQQTLLVGIGMAGAGRKEQRRLAGTLGNHEVSSIFCTLTGRSLAYFSLYCVNLLFAQVILPYHLEFPDNGSLVDGFILMVPFLFSTIFMGLTVSLLFKRREHSILILVFLSPLVLFLSGLSWPSNVLPPALAKLALIFPTTSMIPAWYRIRTIGASLSDCCAELLFLTLQMFVYGLVAMFSYHVSLRRELARQ